MPLALPVGRERCGQRLLAAVVDIEQQVIGALLLEAELVLTLGNEVSAAGVVAPRQEVEGEGESGAGDLDGVSPVHLDPLVLLVKVDGIAVRALDEPGLAHDMRGNAVAGLVLEGADRLVEADADEVPKGSAHRLRMRIDDIPVVIHATTAVSSYREVLIHEGRTQVLGIEAIAQFQLHGRRIAGSDNILRGMLGGIAAVHPEAGRIV